MLWMSAQRPREGHCDWSSGGARAGIAGRSKRSWMSASIIAANSSADGGGATAIGTACTRGARGESCWAAPCGGSAAGRTPRRGAASPSSVSSGTAGPHQPTNAAVRMREADRDSGSVQGASRLGCCVGGFGGARLARPWARRDVATIGASREQRAASVATAGFELPSAGSPLESTNDTDRSVTISQWYGRLGNNIIQMVNAILFCQQWGYSKLILPPDRSHVRIFDLPENMNISYRTLGNKLDCNWNHLATHYFFGRCFAVNKRLYHRTIKQYLRPYFTEKTITACQKEHARPFDGLTIHLRSGDTAKSTARTSSATQTAYASCNFFDTIVAERKFEAVRIVTEPDQSHPCIHLLRDRLPSMNVSFNLRNRSVEEDACALMNAKYLAVGSWSTFSQTLEMFNDKLDSLFWPVPPKGTMKMLDSHCVPVVNASLSKTYVYEISGMQGIHNNLGNAESVEYFTRNSSQGVKLVAVCDQEREVPFAGSVSLR